jgi:hypothetical protein
MKRHMDATNSTTITSSGIASSFGGPVEHLVGMGVSQDQLEIDLYRRAAGEGRQSEAKLVPWLPPPKHPQRDQFVRLQFWQWMMTRWS